MPEKQNTEYKKIWKDEYLRWVCGFANAQGGTLVIGKNNNEEIVNLTNSKRLLEDLPNKIRDILGIVVDINLYETKQGNYIEIIVEPQTNAVNYKGEYHYRSGSTKQELKGAALDKFLLRKHGKHWDSVLIPNVSITELKKETFDFFKEKGIKSNRIDESSKNDNPIQVLENLKLVEQNNLKRSALLLFHPDPEKFITGAYIKIGFFHSDSDLLFQDEVHGNLFEQVEKTMELLLTKYTKALISYEGISRIETYEYPKEALREAIHNAVAHKDYSGAIPIQISVYKDKIMIWNYGQLPEGWTTKSLLEKHSSQPHNPDIANAFFRVGYIESWGRGMDKIKNKCIEANLPIPTLSAKGHDFWIVFRKEIDLSAFNLNERQLDALAFFRKMGKISTVEYMKHYNISERTARYDLSELVEKNLISKHGERKQTTYNFADKLPIKPKKG